LAILVTGAAGFIGSALTLRLLQRGDRVVGIDNHNDYYDPAIKEARLARHIHDANYSHYRVDLSDTCAIEKVFEISEPTVVVNLAAQAGVRHSIDNPLVYLNSNILGFGNILECARKYSVHHLVYASSSSVYGSSGRIPFSTRESVGHPLNIYAASKRSNELMAHAYSHIHRIPTTGLRFFTVYGPWGRPDMALFKFTKAILQGEEIELFNFGNHRRDFTYIDDIVECIIRVMDDVTQPNLNWTADDPDLSTSQAPWRICNIGNGRPVELTQYIKALEDSLGIKAKVKLLSLQPGDVIETCADMEAFYEKFNYKPETNIVEGISRFVSWYQRFFGV
jgi:UDP-glucuronate 4-epimerase